MVNQTINIFQTSATNLLSKLSQQEKKKIQFWLKDSAELPDKVKCMQIDIRPKRVMELPWWSSGQDSTLPMQGTGFDPWWGN